MAAAFRRLSWQVQIGSIVFVVAILVIAGFLALQQFQAGEPIGTTAATETVDVGGAAQIIPQGERPFGITVIGEGEVIVRPDRAVIVLGVEARAETAAAAAADTNEIAEAVITAVTDLGVAESDIQTTALTLTPVYADQPPAARSELLPVGYVSANTLSITVRALERASEVVDAALAAGANTLRSIRFTLSDDIAAQHKQAALRLATLDAARKARAIAEALQGNVRGLISLDEEFAGGPQPLARVGAVLALEAAAPGVPVEPGELRVRAAVRATFAYE
jgi:uncharacterized protein YggE